MDIRLKSGRTVYANNGIFGLSPELEISEGYDGTVHWPPSDYEKPETSLTTDDMREIADMMIARWVAFKETLECRLSPKSPKPPGNQADAPPWNVIVKAQICC